MIEDYLDSLFWRVSKRIGRPQDQIDQFAQILKKNWYDSEETIADLKDEDFQKMEIPHRIYTAIRQQINQARGVSQNINKQSHQNGSSLSKKPLLTQDKIFEMSIELQTGVLAECNNNGPAALNIFERLLRIVKNIVSDPNEAKFRVLKKSNKLIFQTVVSHSSCLKFIKSIGFCDEGEALVMSEPQIHELCSIQECLSQMIERMHGSKKIARQQTMQQQHLIQNDQKLHKVYARDQHQQDEYISCMDNLIDHRRKVMTRIPEDRRLRIFHKRFEIKQIDVPKYSLVEEFQKSNDQTVRESWKKFLQYSNSNKGIQNIDSLALEHELKQNFYKEACIKIRLPNELIVEGWFAPYETLGDVFGWVAKIVIGNLYLYTTPPVKVMKQQLKRTLQQLEVVPNGSFFLGANGAWHIAQEFSHLVHN